jgi:hypothetical protein
VDPYTRVGIPRCIILRMHVQYIKNVTTALALMFISTAEFLTHHETTGASTIGGPSIPIVAAKIEHQFLATQTLLTCAHVRQVIRSVIVR